MSNPIYRLNKPITRISESDEAYLRQEWKHQNEEKSIEFHEFLIILWPFFSYEDDTLPDD